MILRLARAIGHVRLSLLVGLLAASGVSGAADKRPITETDLFRFTWLADPQISPDGTQVAFVEVTVAPSKEEYETSLFMVSTGGEPPRRFTNGPYDASPRWSPDGKRLAFLRGVKKEGESERHPQIYLLALDGGEALPLTHLPRGAQSPTWSPDGRRLAFTSRTGREDLEEGKGTPAHKSDVRVITKAVYRSNAIGYLNPKGPSHIWSIETPAKAGEQSQPKQVTTGEFDENDPQWSPDGSRIYFRSTRVREPYYDPPDVDLYTVPAGGGEMTRAASIDGVIHDFSVSSDGKRVVFIGSLNSRPVRSYNQPDLFVTGGEAGAATQNLTVKYDFDVGAGLTGDQHAPRGSHPLGPLWTKDLKSVLVTTAERGRTNLKRVDVASGKVEAFTTGDHEIVSFTSTPDATKVVAVVSTPVSIGDLFIVDTASGKMTPLTHVNDALLEEISLTPPEEISYSSFDGKKIQAWVQKPPGFDSSKKYPLILDIHGGPHAAHGYTFFHEVQWMAAKGYVVLYPNPRGSTSYGQDFANIIQYRYPGDDYKDLMAGVDELIRRGYVDPQHMGVTGGSGGGVLTNWTITQTDRFAAAVSQRSIADWAGFWYTADFTLFQPTWFRGAPWQDPGDFAARSAISHIARVKTPLMLVEGEGDYRTPPGDGGEQMFRALKFLRKPVVMVRFPGESHELSRSGKPWHRVERLQHILNWFDKYLQGKAVEDYEVP